MRKAFTLIELLVVIAIVAILAALLMPALETARRSALKVQCVGRLHQLMLSTHMYENAYHKVLPPRLTINDYKLDPGGNYWSGWSADQLLYEADLLRRDGLYNISVPPGGGGYSAGIRRVDKVMRARSMTLCPACEYNRPPYWGGPDPPVTDDYWEFQTSHKNFPKRQPSWTSPRPTTFFNYSVDWKWCELVNTSKPLAPLQLVAVGSGRGASSEMLHWTETWIHINNRESGAGAQTYYGTRHGGGRNYATYDGRVATVPHETLQDAIDIPGDALAEEELPFDIASTTIGHEW